MLMNETILNYPKSALMVIAYKKGINGNTPEAAEKLQKCADAAFSTNSRETFLLEMIANVTDKKLEDVMKAALDANIQMSKNAEGKYYIVGKNLIALADTELFGGSGVQKEEKRYPKERPEKKKEVKEAPLVEETEVKEDVEKAVTLRTKKKKESEKVIMEDMVTKEISARKKEDKPKTGKSLLKNILTGSSSMDVVTARRFLIEKKIKSPVEVALMSDPDILKFATKDYVFFSVENINGKCEVAVSKDEISKLDLSRFIIIS